MTIRLYNTLAREKQVFEPLDPERVTMYVCGPTVYNYAHIGNARPAVVFDLLHRLLELHYPEVVEWDKLVKRWKALQRWNKRRHRALR